ncbi:PD-(D/E)XK nuclease-like domain-containing protein [Streptomyces sp. NBC_00237]|uniref:PD-(D/E)XK nuclease-like domain-containing protein n=1 Tax=Streptomyces sp. NBC_00237 TaxID=2975687 RepID=UPI0022589B25|nr:PD-(D/E)XK nuclease-like domain-containing protein [Streptomyces sp. NBC_00237]MCX5201087.1 PD-(D/E)XK nuclease-like domain-containing protein [Streptomyces sp. NBC_00237]
METTVQAGASAPAAGSITEPGLYDMTAEQYHADRSSLSSSGARRLLASCPALFRYEQDHPQPYNPVFALGTAAHRLALGDGPDLVAIEADDWRTKAARQERDEVHAAGGVALLASDFDRVQDMADALRRHPVASALFAPGSGRPEASLFWRDEPTGVMRRARFDWLPDPRNGRLIIPDYKTCRSAEPAALARAVEEYGYHQQADWYRAGARALGLADADAAFVFVCQEKAAPYLVTVVELDAAALRIGAAKNRRAIDTFARCVETGHWPGYADDIAYLSLPVWAEIRDTEEYL